MKHIFKSWDLYDIQNKSLKSYQRYDGVCFVNMDDEGIHISLNSETFQITIDPHSLLLQRVELSLKTFFQGHADNLRNHPSDEDPPQYVIDVLPGFSIEICEWRHYYVIQFRYRTAEGFIMETNIILNETNIPIFIEMFQTIADALE